MYTYQINEIYDSTYGHYIVMIIRLYVMSHFIFFERYYVRLFRRIRISFYY